MPENLTICDIPHKNKQLSRLAIFGDVLKTQCIAFSFNFVEFL
jgi:hypothetical protein